MQWCLQHLGHGVDCEYVHYQGRLYEGYVLDLQELARLEAQRWVVIADNAQYVNLFQSVGPDYLASILTLEREALIAKIARTLHGLVIGVLHALFEIVANDLVVASFTMRPINVLISVRISFAGANILCMTASVTSPA